MKTILAAILLFASAAQAVDFEISVGQTTYDKSGNGQWYQEGLDYKFDLQANSIGFSFTDYLTDGLRWRAGYINLGKLSSVAIATTDANFSGSGCIGQCAEKSVFVGHGKVEGIYLTVAPEIRVGKTKLFAEVGAWGYIPHFNMTVYSNNPPDCVNSNANCARKVWDRTTDEHMQFGAVIGFGIEYDDMQIIVTSYGTQVSQVNGDTVPNWGERTTNVSLRKRF